MLLNTILSLTLAITPTTPSTSDIPTTELRDQLTALVNDRYLTAGLIHVQDGTNQWSDAVGVRDLTTRKPADPRGHFRIGSVTKTFVATVLLQLVDERRLALDDPIERHLPGLVPDGEHLAVRQILRHTSRLHDYMSEPGYSTNRWRGAARFDDYAPEELLEVAFTAGEGNAGWRYSNTNYIVAGLLIEKLTGRPYGEEVSRRSWTPRGWTRRWIGPPAR